ncbi:MAG: hypothetical protein ACK2TV_08765 [Anaerolineales bacterium]
MKRLSITLPEAIYCICFICYLAGSSLALIEHGTELSLWIMFLTVMISFATRTLPWVGIKWLRIEKKGVRWGWWMSLLLQFSSWVTFSLAMLYRLGRNLSLFYLWILLTTLLWATWLLIFIYSLHANQQTNPEPPQYQPNNPPSETIQKEV